ncbi:ABC transporter ATP-binding protein [Rhodohalobacter mucosus]|uniref:Multidrug ABC transporter ATP-binding protein n=1 Tax=Rhodohalobacter mucosus TaxID=2079485 RepID=A0A316U118_9BACT|nr:ABC transporter ATP-binding protein [Rhodohalobacter mucosus]PWN06516.1 multidrug ABC transporter ATP-binding protein [Rhodohalobacter mucosus]
MSLEIKNLSKTYPNGVRAMDSISLKIGKGMFGLLGPNGAGKSTLMRTLATLQYPDSGEIRFNGKPVNSRRSVTGFRSVIGYLPQEFGVYPNRSAADLLNYLGVLKGLTRRSERQTRVQQVLELTNLTHVEDEAVSSFSGGMKQRFGIAQLLLNKPQLMIVDEPTAGLDPSERKHFLNMLKETGLQSTVIFSTHIVEDVRDLCNDLAIIHQGKIRVQCAPSEALRIINGKIWVKHSKTRLLSDTEALPSIYPLSSRYTDQGAYEIRVHSDQRPGPDFESATATLEDFYFAAINGLLP